MSAITCDAVYARLGLSGGQPLFDIRNDAALRDQPRMLPGARRLDGIGCISQLRAHAAPLVLYGAGDEDEPRPLLENLRSAGHAVSILDGGLTAWMQRSYPTVRMRPELGAPGGSRWVTRERPKIDRLACPWLVRRFIDPDALFFYVPAHQVRSDAQALGAEPYDIADVTFSHRGERCSFDAFLEEFDLRDPCVDRLAKIVRAADTGRASESHEAPGLLAISLGLSASIADDTLLLEQAIPMYDALYAWCKTAHDETHSWPQQAPTGTR